MPQFSVDSRTIDNVIGYINNGQISIPEIQRPFVWKSTKIRDLIDSLYNGFPVGYLIVWQNPSMKDRKGMTLSFEDVKHYGRIIYVLQQTKRLMGDIDKIMKEE